MQQPHEFQYGPIAKGVFYGLASLSLLVMLAFPELLIYHMLLLLFLGLGLKPLLLKTGLYAVYEHIAVSIGERKDRGFTEKRRKQVERQERDKKYRHSRVKDPRLPRDW